MGIAASTNPYVRTAAIQAVCTVATATTGAVAETASAAFSDYGLTAAAAPVTAHVSTSCLA